MLTGIVQRWQNGRGSTPGDLSIMEKHLRFGLYVAVGLGPWLDAALVERLLDTALD